MSHFAQYAEVGKAGLEGGNCAKGPGDGPQRTFLLANYIKTRKKNFMKKLLLLASVLAFAGLAHADLSMPKKPNFYDKAGRGLANVILAPAHLFDSPYSLLQEEGPTVSVTKGFVQGTSRAVMDTAHGIYELITAPFPPYESLKLPAYDSAQQNPYPPADLIDNWY
jgi:putative exosortase-associated protein (TIGR04073 family)